MLMNLVFVVVGWVSNRLTHRRVSDDVLHLIVVHYAKIAVAESIGGLWFTSQNHFGTVFNHRADISCSRATAFARACSAFA